MTGPIVDHIDWLALLTSPPVALAIVAVLFVTIVFLDRASKRRGRERERHLRALERIARAQDVANSRQDQPRRDP
jgi:hypothetical protein